MPHTATCRVALWGWGRIQEPQARRAKPEAYRLFSLADLRIDKRKLSVLSALSEAPQSGMRARAVQDSRLLHYRLFQKTFQLLELLLEPLKL